MIAVIGAGISGLNFACAYNGSDEVIVFEKEDVVGGWCGSFSAEGVVADFGGHYAHYRTQSERDLFELFVPKFFWTERIRRSKVLINGKIFDYPVQLNLAPLGKKALPIVKNFASRGLFSKNDTYRQWLYSSFGTSLVKVFSEKYDSKKWVYPLDSIVGTDWVPEFSEQDIVSGIDGGTVGAGYNYHALYPASGGFGSYPSFLAKACTHKIVHETVIEIDPYLKIIWTVRNGKTKKYFFDKLVSSAPLISMLTMLGTTIPFSPRYIDLELAVVSGTQLLSEVDWLYVVDPKALFHLVQFRDDCVVAERTVSPYEPDSDYDYVAHFERLNILQDARLLKRIVRQCAFAAPRGKRAVIDEVLASLAEIGIFSIGRFGSWKYSCMFQDIRAAVDLAGVIDELSV